MDAEHALVDEMEKVVEEKGEKKESAVLNTWDGFILYLLKVTFWQDGTCFVLFKTGSSRSWRLFLAKINSYFVSGPSLVVIAVWGFAQLDVPGAGVFTFIYVCMRVCACVRVWIWLRGIL